MSVLTHARFERAPRRGQQRRPDRARPASLQATALGLQRSAGNAAVTQLIQRWGPLFTGWRVPVKIDYDKATKRNKKYAKSLKWESRLAGLKPEWDKAWKAANYGDFADQVAAFQQAEGFDTIDGELGPATWNRVRPIGEVIAERNVNWEKSEWVCSIATQERVTEGYQQATGTALVDEANKAQFRIIHHSISSEMHKVDEQYRATGAAGALVYLGVGTFVDQDAIWDDKALKPGAAMQVWRKNSDVDRVKRGKEPLSSGTSFVFLEYVGDDAMRVKHFGAKEVVKKRTYQYWVGANLNER
jgi:hypothetical protein